jgi:hypothetical protein
MMASGLVSSKTLSSLFLDSIVKDGLSEEFMFNLFRAWLKIASINSYARRALPLPFPLPASRFPLPASRFPLPASRFPLPASLSSRQGSRCNFWDGRLATSFRKGGIDQKLDLIYPINKRSQEHLLKRVKEEGDLGDILTWLNSQRSSALKKDLQEQIVEAMHEEQPQSAVRKQQAPVAARAAP